MGRFSLDGYTDKCVRMLNDMINPKYVKADKQVPLTLLRHCEGIAFITIWKAGLFFLGANAGAGCVISKVKDETDPRGWRWSGPAAVVCGGLGGGFIFGGEKIDSIIILNTKSAVRAFMGDGQVTFGGNLSLAAGPVGRDLEGHVGVSKNKEIVAAYSYSKAMGIYIGATLEGAFLMSKNDDNKKFYNDQNVTPEKILSGQVRPPLKVDSLHRELYAIHDRKGDYSQLESTHGKFTAEMGSDATAPGISAPTAPGAPGGEVLQPNWRKVFTDDGKAYYHNTVTNETRWDAPLAAPQAFPTAAPQASPFTNQSSRSIPVAAEISYNSQQGPALAASNAVNTGPSQRQVIPPRPIPPRPTAPTRETAVALYDFVGSRPDELSFKANDTLTIISKDDPNWFSCNINGKTGLAPSNYLKF